MQIHRRIRFLLANWVTSRLVACPTNLTDGGSIALCPGQESAASKQVNYRRADMSSRQHRRAVGNHSCSVCVCICTCNWTGKQCINAIWPPVSCRKFAPGVFLPRRRTCRAAHLSDAPMLQQVAQKTDSVDFSPKVQWNTPKFAVV